MNLPEQDGIIALRTRSKMRVDLGQMNYKNILTRRNIKKKTESGIYRLKKSKVTVC